MAQFIVEARELVQAAIDDLFALETDPANGTHLDSVFRAVHTLKGSAGLFDLPVLHATLHRAEDILGRVRSDAGSLDAPQIDAVISVLEWTDRCVDELERDGVVSAQQLIRAEGFQGTLNADNDRPPESGTRNEAGSIAWALSLAARIGGPASVAVRYRPHAECFFSGDDPIALVSRIPSLTHLSIEPATPWPGGELFDPFRCNLAFEALSTAPLSEVEAIFRLVPDQVEIAPLGTATASAAESAPAEIRAEVMRGLRVDPARIDALLDLVGELMTTKSGMAGLATGVAGLPGGGEIARSIAVAQKDLDRLIRALYGGVLQTRMVPLGQAFRRLPRMVRDLSQRLGKPTELTITGDAVEADKTIVDELFEPLLHLVRNAMDHGIESAAERFAAGKPATAKLSLQVVIDGDQIVISLSDDGRGIDAQTIRRAAVRKGIVDADTAAALDDQAALGLLFSPGFSTATTVSDLSGRGVGLDAVRKDVTRLRGTVTLTSRLGHGATTALRLPFGFAMTQLLIVSVGTERYGVPMQAVMETVRIGRGAVTPIRDNRAFVLRDRTVPLLSLPEMLGLPDSQAAGDMTVLVMAVANQRVGIIVDAIAEHVEAITRPLGGLLTGTPGVAGTAVLENGQVMLVLDIAELIG